MTAPRAADDFPAIRARLDELSGAVKPRPHSLIIPYATIPEVLSEMRWCEPCDLPPPVAEPVLP